LRKWIFNIVLVLWALGTYATHNRAGEITYKQIDELTYEITLVTYTYAPSAANETREKLEVSWGDNVVELIDRETQTALPDNYLKNVYIGQHSYPGPGIYKIVMEDPNRNQGVDNIPGSVNVVFSIATILKIDAELGFNSTPVLLNPPIDKATVGQVFIHNPSAFDAEGDSLSYGLTICRQENGQEIPNYTFPPASNDLYVDPITGDFVWDTPTEEGTYNVAMLIEEWREGIKIGQIIRDMQIDVEQGSNIKPQMSPLLDYCVEAGQSLNFDVEAVDANSNMLLFDYYGGPFELSDFATVTSVFHDFGSFKYNFNWDTECHHVRKSPYQAVFKVRDTIVNPMLVDIKSSMITIVSPGPENLEAEPSFNSIELNWDACICSGAVAYDIYRKKSPSHWMPDECELGIPDELGFEKIGTNQGYSSTNFIDNNDGQGLSQGYQYCYRVVAIFPDGAESYASDEFCTELELGYPLITKVSVDTTSSTEGRMNLSWAKYLDFDTVSLSGPYVYLIYRSEDRIGSNLELIDSTLSINSTSYTDSVINTESQIYSYSVEFFNNSPGKRELIGDPQLASSPFLNLYPGDNLMQIELERSTPWVNDTMVIYRMGPNQTEFDSIGYSLDDTYIDSNLVNEKTYCYYVKTIGHYPPEEYDTTIINFSQELCAKPIDTIPPCPPTTFVESFCDEYYNQITWSVADSCLEDIYNYNIYYTPVLDGEMELIHTAISPLDSVYLHYPEESIAGCYAVTAVDSFENESAKSKICIDNCTYYELPNVFTPNGDGQNDVVRPGPYKFVEKVDMKIYNRWGNLVFKTEDPDILWDGRYMENGKLLSPAVYYYVCDVYEHRLTGIEVRNLSGFIHLYDSKKNANSDE
jgi:gliding motility-associated-like protein